MDTQQKDMEYLANLKRQIKEMDPLERICSTVILTLGRAVAELLNRHEHQVITEMEQVVIDIFKQARIARDQTSDIIQ